jgi:L-fuconolactonase
MSSQLTNEDAVNLSGDESHDAIDTHVHFWKYNATRDTWISDNMKVLKQHYLPEDLALSAKRNRVEGCVAIQVDQSELENYFLIELAKTHPFIKGVVGWIDLQAENLEDRLNHFSEFPIIKGWRHIVQAEANDFLLRRSFQQGVQRLKKFNHTYDILVYHYQLDAVVNFVSNLPDQKLIIDHCAKPDIRNHEINNWRSLMKEIAQHPQVYCKLSGLFTEANWRNWSASDFFPYLDTVFDAFGTERLLFGSDWPVMLLSGAYVQWKSLLEKYMEQFKPEDKEKIFYRNAIRFYNL